MGTGPSGVFDRRFVLDHGLGALAVRAGGDGLSESLLNIVARIELKLEIHHHRWTIVAWVLNLGGPIWPGLSPGA